MERDALAGLAWMVAGLVISGSGAHQWRRRADLIEQSNAWFAPGDGRWQAINRVRVPLGAVVLAVLGLMLIASGIVDVVRALF